jgi:hypothetical protein
MRVVPSSSASIVPVTVSTVMSYGGFAAERHQPDSSLTLLA